MAKKQQLCFVVWKPTEKYTFIPQHLLDREQQCLAPARSILE